MEYEASNTKTIQIKVKKIILFFLLFFSLKSFSQDPIFTQFHNVPEYLNPSFTGAGEGSQIGIINRSQWFGLNYGLNSQFFYFDGYIDNINSGLGINILNHHESITKYNFTQINCAENSNIEFNKIQNDTARSKLIDTLNVYQKSDSVCTVNTVIFGGLFIRNNLNFEQNNFKKEIEKNKEDYEKIIENATDQIEEFVKKTNLENPIQ